MNRSADNLNKLIRIENRMCDIVCNGRVASDQEAKTLYSLRRVTGMQYDALNGRFTEWSDIDNE